MSTTQKRMGRPREVTRACKVVFYLSAGLLSELAQAADRREISRSAMLRQILRSWFESGRKPR